MVDPDDRSGVRGARVRRGTTLTELDLETVRRPTRERGEPLEPRRPADPERDRERGKRWGGSDTRRERPPLDSYPSIPAPREDRPMRDRDRRDSDPGRRGRDWTLFAWTMLSSIIGAALVAGAIYGATIVRLESVEKVQAEHARELRALATDSRLGDEQLGGRIAGLEVGAAVQTTTTTALEVAVKDLTAEVRALRNDLSRRR